MIPWVQDWRMAVGLVCLSWGLWGFSGKLAAAKAGWPTAALVSWAAGMLVVLPMVLPRAAWPGAGGLFWSALHGVCGALGGIFFLQALQQGPASVVLPLAEGYLVIAVLLAVIFLGEQITWLRLAGMLMMAAGAALLVRQ